MHLTSWFCVGERDAKASWSRRAFTTDVLLLCGYYICMHASVELFFEGTLQQKKLVDVSIQLEQQDSEP